MIDQRIILHILYHNTVECAARPNKFKKEYSLDAAFIFFPFTKRGYYEKLSKLEARQYLQRLNMLCPILGRNN